MRSVLTLKEHTLSKLLCKVHSFVKKQNNSPLHSWYLLRIQIKKGMIINKALCYNLCLGDHMFIKKYINTVFIIIGTISVCLGVIGIFVPVLPTTPFLLLAAACYTRGSKKLYERLINHPVLGEYIKNYREGRGIPLKAKIISISLLWLTIGFSVLFIIENLLLRILLIIIAICVTIHLVSIKTMGNGHINDQNR